MFSFFQKLAGVFAMLIGILLFILEIVMIFSAPDLFAKRHIEAGDFGAVITFIIILLPLCALLLWTSIILFKDAVIKKKTYIMFLIMFSFYTFLFLGLKFISSIGIVSGARNNEFDFLLPVIPIFIFIITIIFFKHERDNN